MIVIMIIIIVQCCHIVSLWLTWVGKIRECHLYFAPPLTRGVDTFHWAGRAGRGGAARVFHGAGQGREPLLYTQQCKRWWTWRTSLCNFFSNLCQFLARKAFLCWFKRFARNLGIHAHYARFYAFLCNFSEAESLFVLFQILFACLGTLQK